MAKPAGRNSHTTKQVDLIQTSVHVVQFLGGEGEGQEKGGREGKSSKSPQQDMTVANYGSQPKLSARSREGPCARGGVREPPGALRAWAWARHKGRVLGPLGVARGILVLGRTMKMGTGQN